MQRTVRLTVHLTLTIVLSAALASQTQAQDIGSIDGTWEGHLSYARGSGLKEAPIPAPEFVVRLVIDGKTARVYNVKGSNADEVKPSGFRVVRLLTNALIVAIHSGTEAESTGSETWRFA